MMFPMISKMIAAYKGPEYREIVTSSPMVIFEGFGQLTVRQKGTKIKQLQGAEQRRYNPEDDQINRRYFEYMEQYIE